MKTIEYWEFYIDCYSNYGTLSANFSSLEIMKEKLKQSDALKRHMVMTLNSVLNTYGVSEEDIKDLDIDVEMKEENWADVRIRAVGTSIIQVKVGEKSEVKEPGKPYEPAQNIYETKEVDLSERKIVVSAYRKEFKLDGIPTNYGKVI